ncbi:P-type conjugative transfer protein TrbJ [Bradyrhizobium prioriisuperbiae]|uniref:P-type conjugative transfer protein TrbJ n=1 Tax=Bradyrhizobium prioriisuperbiae TaxID=2854389 RepID=UPI0028E3F20E|nr:P-type conjugative transfer protein TrbJ [Bradyrhizobium prioritasuperba]
MLRKLISKVSLRNPLTIVAIILLVLVIAVNGSRRLGAQIVFDPSNYSQNVLTAARTLEQINNQIRSLENQAQMLINQAKNLASLPSSVVGQLTSHINEINSLIAQAKGITFDIQNTSSDFERLYPRQYSAAVSSDRMVRDATSRWDNTYQAFRQTLLTQATIASNLTQDGQTLKTLMAGSSGATGSLQALQSSNELLALQIKQSLQTQALIATQARADALRAVEQQSSAAAAQERFTRFIGNGRAYSAGK